MTPQINTLLGALYAITLTLISGYLIHKGKMTKKIYLPLLIITLLMGFVLSGPYIPLRMMDIFAGSQQGQILIIMATVVVALILSSLLWGRSFCAFACPIGAAQELAYRVPVKKMMVKKSHALPVRWAVTIVMILSALLFSLNLIGYFGISDVFSLAPSILSGVFIAMVIVSIWIYRPFCRLICPFGAFSSILSRYSMFRMGKENGCNECGRCSRVCPTGEIESDGSECYLCLRCVEQCNLGFLKLDRRKL